MNVGDKIPVARMYTRSTGVEYGVVKKVMPHDEFWVKLPGFDGTILVRPGQGYRSY